MAVIVNANILVSGPLAQRGTVHLHCPCFSISALQIVDRTGRSAAMPDRGKKRVRPKTRSSSSIPTGLQELPSSKAGRPTLHADQVALQAELEATRAYVRSQRSRYAALRRLQATLSHLIVLREGSQLERLLSLMPSSSPARSAQHDAHTAICALALHLLQRAGRVIRPELEAGVLQTLKTWRPSLQPAQVRAAIDGFVAHSSGTVRQAGQTLFLLQPRGVLRPPLHHLGSALRFLSRSSAADLATSQESALLWSARLWRSLATFAGHQPVHTNFRCTPEPPSAGRPFEVSAGEMPAAHAEVPAPLTCASHWNPPKRARFEQRLPSGSAFQTFAVPPGALTWTPHSVQDPTHDVCDALRCGKAGAVAAGRHMCLVLLRAKLESGELLLEPARAARRLQLVRTAEGGNIAEGDARLFLSAREQAGLGAQALACVAAVRAAVAEASGFICADEGDSSEVMLKPRQLKSLLRPILATQRIAASAVSAAEEFELSPVPDTVPCGLEEPLAAMADRSGLGFCVPHAAVLQTAARSELALRQVRKAISSLTSRGVDGRVSLELPMMTSTFCSYEAGRWAVRHLLLLGNVAQGSPDAAVQHVLRELFRPAHASSASQVGVKWAAPRMLKSSAHLPPALELAVVKLLLPWAGMNGTAQLLVKRRHGEAVPSSPSKDVGETASGCTVVDRSSDDLVLRLPPVPQKPAPRRPTGSGSIRVLQTLCQRSASYSRPALSTDSLDWRRLCHEQRWTTREDVQVALAQLHTPSGPAAVLLVVLWALQGAPPSPLLQFHFTKTCHEALLHLDEDVSTNAPDVQEDASTVSSCDSCSEAMPVMGTRNRDLEHSGMASGLVQNLEAFASLQRALQHTPSRVEAGKELDCGGWRCELAWEYTVRHSACLGGGTPEQALALCLMGLRLLARGGGPFRMLDNAIPDKGRQELMRLLDRACAAFPSSPCLAHARLQAACLLETPKVPLVHHLVLDVAPLGQMIARRTCPEWHGVLFSRLSILITAGHTHRALQELDMLCLAETAAEFQAVAPLSLARLHLAHAAVKGDEAAVLLHASASTLGPVSFCSSVGWGHPIQRLQASTAVAGPGAGAAVDPCSRQVWQSCFSTFNIWCKQQHGRVFGVQRASSSLQALILSILGGLSLLCPEKLASLCSEAGWLREPNAALTVLCFFSAHGLSTASIRPLLHCVQGVTRAQRKLPGPETPRTLSLRARLALALISAAKSHAEELPGKDRSCISSLHVLVCSLTDAASGHWEGASMLLRWGAMHSAVRATSVPPSSVLEVDALGGPDDSTTWQCTSALLEVFSQSTEQPGVAMSEKGCVSVTDCVVGLCAAARFSPPSLLLDALDTFAAACHERWYKATMWFLQTKASFQVALRSLWGVMQAHVLRIQAVVACHATQENKTALQRAAVSLCRGTDEAGSFGFALLPWGSEKAQHVSAAEAQHEVRSSVALVQQALASLEVMVPVSSEAAPCEDKAAVRLVNWLSIPATSHPSVLPRLPVASFTALRGAWWDVLGDFILGPQCLCSGLFSHAEALQLIHGEPAPHYTLPKSVRQCLLPRWPWHCQAALASPQVWGSLRAVAHKPTLSALRHALATSLPCLTPLPGTSATCVKNFAGCPPWESALGWDHVASLPMLTQRVPCDEAWAVLRTVATPIEAACHLAAARRSLAARPMSKVLWSRILHLIASSTHSAAPADLLRLAICCHRWLRVSADAMDVAWCALHHCIELVGEGGDKWRSSVEALARAAAVIGLQHGPGGEPVHLFRQERISPCSARLSPEDEECADADLVALAHIQGMGVPQAAAPATVNPVADAVTSRLLGRLPRAVWVSLPEPTSVPSGLAQLRGAGPIPETPGIPGAVLQLPAIREALSTGQATVDSGSAELVQRLVPGATRIILHCAVQDALYGVFICAGAEQVREGYAVQLTPVVRAGPVPASRVSVWQEELRATLEQGGAACSAVSLQRVVVDLLAMSLEQGGK